MGNNVLLFESLFNTQMDAEDMQDYLAQLAGEYPYFAPAQFYLLQKLAPGTPEFNSQAARTSILFNNPHWLSLQLQDTIETARQNRNAPSGRNEPAPVAITESNSHVPEEPVVVEAELASPEVEEVSRETESEPLTTIPETTPPEHESESAADTSERTAASHNVESAYPAYTEEETLAEALADEPVVEEPFVMPATETEEYDNLDRQEEKISDAPDEDNIDVAPYEEAVSVENRTNEIIGAQTGELSATEQPAFTEEDHLPPLDEPVDAETANTGIRLPRLPDLDAPVTEDTLSFEPLHTTDYFASQGIRLSNELKSDDRLGKQLRSFTEWLKTMKKIHTENLGESDVVEEKLIQNLAERSNKDADIVTEAMADVFIQQGKLAKAKETYQKLSLLDPSKSAYFAAKIDQLNK